MAPAAYPDYAPLALPKRYAAIEHVEGTIPFAGAAVSNPLRIDPSGFLHGLLLTFSGTCTTGATAPVNNNQSPYGIVSRVTLTVGGGVGRTVDVSMYELNVMERAREQDYVDAPSNPVTASTANNWTFDVFVPTCVRFGDLYGTWSDFTGAIYTGDPTITCTLTLTFTSANGSSVFSNATAAAATIAGNFTVTSFKWDVPQPSLDKELLAAISWSHVLLEERSDVGANQMPYLMPTNEPRVYLRTALCYGDGAGRDTGANSFSFKNSVLTTWDLNLQDYVHFFDTVPEQVLRAQQLRRYATALPAGTYVADFSASMYRRQWFPVDRVTLFKNNPVVPAPPAGATLQLINESLVPSPLARKWIAQFFANGGDALQAA